VGRHARCAKRVFVDAVVIEHVEVLFATQRDMAPLQRLSGLLAFQLAT